MSRPKLHWPFWVGAMLVVGEVVCSVIQWIRDADKPNHWIVAGVFGLVFLCMWYESILQSNHEADREQRQIRWEVRQAVREAMNPNKVARVVDAEAERVDHG